MRWFMPLVLVLGVVSASLASELIELQIHNPTAYKLTLSDIEKS